MTRQAESLPWGKPACDEQSFRVRIWRKRLELSAVLSMAMLYACSYFQRIAVPGTIFNQLQTDLSLDAAGVTALAAIYLYIYAAMQIVVGFLADRLGGRKLILIGGVLLSIGAILFPLSQSPGTLYFTRALVGLGASAMFLSIVEQIDEMFTARTFSYLIGPLTVAGLLGGMTGTLPFERTVAMIGWRAALLAVGICTALAMIMTLLTQRMLPPTLPPVGAVTFRPLWGVITNRWSLPVVIGGSLNFAIYFVFQGVIGKKMLEDHGKLASAQAAGVMFAMILIAMGLALCAGPISLMFGHRRKPPILIGALVMIASMSAGLIGIAGPVEHAAPWLIAAFFGAASSSSLGPIYICAIKEVNCPDAVALSVSVINMTTYVAIAILSHVVGQILDAFSAKATALGSTTIYPPSAYAILFVLLIGLGVIVLISVCFVRETHGRSQIAQ